VQNVKCKNLFAYEGITIALRLWQLPRIVEERKYVVTFPFADVQYKEWRKIKGMDSGKYLSRAWRMYPLLRESTWKPHGCNMCCAEQRCA